jgi:hypothetical protein
MSFSEFFKAIQQSPELSRDLGPRPRAGMQLGPVKGKSTVSSRLSTPKPGAPLTAEQLQALVAEK